MSMASHGNGSATLTQMAVSTAWQQAAVAPDMQPTLFTTHTLIGYGLYKLFKYIMIVKLSNTAANKMSILILLKLFFC